MGKGSGGNAAAVTLAPTAIMPIDVPQTALALELPDSTTPEQWTTLGRTLVESRQRIDWLIGDWIAFGRSHFPEQLDLTIDSLGDDTKRLKRIERTAKAFPPHTRHKRLSFEHHAHVADLPVQDALPLLKDAAAEKLSAREFRLKAMMHKVDTGALLPRDDDPENDALMACVRAWNHASREVRREFADMIADSDLSVIDA